METNTAKIRKKLEEDGWYLSRHGAIHDIYRHDGKGLVVTIPRHKSVSPGVARQISKLAAWDD